ncbi:MAG: glycosyltransferase family 2 protein [Proteobacteria bacterium]|nr:glycosyltransferase family 2 protein [Pseudomonadota bacterium]
MSTLTSTELSIVMPCLNEAETLAACIHKAMSFLKSHQIEGEVLIADNGSSDGSQEIAEKLGAKVIHVKEKGYGAALSGGIKAAQGRYVIMGDSDDSYDFSNLMPFIEKLREGHDLVLGNRFRGGIQKGAMPFLHRYLGNPVLSRIGKIFFGSPVGDFHCGLRGFSKSAIESLNLVTRGMEFASEMIVKATLNDLKITEVPTILSPDGRSRPPHLRTWRDGWRHLKFLLLYCPRWLFLYPGSILALWGAIFYALIMTGPLQIGKVNFDIHTLIYAASALVVGYQTMIYAIFAESIGIQRGILPPNKSNQKILTLMTVEMAAITGGFLILLGLGLGLFSIHAWQKLGFGSLEKASQLRCVITSCLALTLGTQTIFSGFFVNSNRD